MGRLWREGKRRGTDLRLCVAACLAVAGSVAGHAQIDPVRRRVIQAGYTLPLHERGPIAGYAYYYHNEPDFPATNLTLRLAVVPVYLDAELGIHEALGEHTDLGVGLNGGGFADSYSEIQQGNYIPEESFAGHGAEGTLSLYHLFNPNSRAPLYGVVRAGLHGTFYERAEETASDFEVPDDLPQFAVRVGLRYGGREPYLTPSLAGEFSVWYEGQFRLFSTAYGYADDRRIEAVTHLFWARALLAYTFESTGHYLQASLNAGTSLDADRLSAYRLGGSLELVSEFPLRLPGYHAQEITGTRYVLLDAGYYLPLDAARRFSTGIFGATAGVDYLAGLEQPGDFNSGVGVALLYRSRSGGLQLGAAYAYGLEAIRNDGRGAHSFSFLLQYDLDAVYRAGEQPFWNPLTGARIWRGLLGIFGQGP